jgi:hypothetical protein
MKTLVTRIGMFAASAVALATMAYGQNMKAEIPFAFQTANATLPAGTYLIYRMSQNGVADAVRLWNEETHHSVLAVALPFDVNRPAANPSIVFACRSEGCTLREIKTTNGTLSYPEHKAKRNGEVASLVSLPLKAANAD